ncbi:MAG: DUF1192 domain-containing protein [Pseudomonadota bacterium]
MDDDLDRAKPKTQPITLGEPLDTLSVGELDERVAALRSEIDRVEAEKARKSAHADAVASVFKT